MYIKINDYVKTYTGPSQNYYAAQSRFESILKYKLGVVTDEMSVKNNLDIFGDSDDTIKNIDDTQTKNETQINTLDSSAIFSNDIAKDSDPFSAVSSGSANLLSNIENLTRKQDSSTTMLNKIVSSVALNGIVDTTDVRKKSNYSAEYLNSKLQGSPLAGMGEDFKRAEDLYGVNSVVLMAIAKLESNFGRSKIAQDKNNLFGYQAFDSSPYSSAKAYATKQDSIYDIAKHLSKNYLTAGASHFNGYSVDGIAKDYCTNGNWASQIKNIVAGLVKK